MATPTVLIILDGWGVAEKSAGNAISQAKIPHYKNLWTNSIHGYLHASGEAVGLPSGTNGNSEVGHLNIGAGFVVKQELSRINSAIDDGSFFNNLSFQNALNHTIEFNSNLHIMGLLSDGNVHSSIEHLKALIKFLSIKNYTKNVYVHLFSDGRDSEQKKFLEYLTDLENTIKEYNIGKTVSLIGRYYAMDRDKKWERTKKAYELLVFNKGKEYDSIREGVKDMYDSGITDEFITPIFTPEFKPISDSDSIIFFNFREDRATQLTQAFIENNFEGFDRGKMLHNIFFVGMTQFSEELPISVAFPSIDIRNPIGKAVSASKKLQFRIAETEKYAHITYFFNGGREIVFPGEERVVIASPKVTTYDLSPQMSAYKTTQRFLDALDSQKYSFLLINFANPDMVGHTGNIPAAIKAIETVDECIGKISKKVFEYEGNLFITADHGNAEEMIHYASGSVDTEHSTNLVPFIYTNGHTFPREIGIGILADIAVSVLSVLKIDKPDTMTGRNLLDIHS